MYVIRARLVRGSRRRAFSAAAQGLATVASPPSLQLVSASEADTLAWGYHLGRVAGPADCILLSGEVGRGKSVFARGFIRGVAGDPGLLVTSPTFTLMNHYAREDDGQLGGNPFVSVTAAAHPAAHQVVHMDLYRLQGTTGELGPLGLPGLFAQGAAVPGGPRDTCFVVEWPEKLHPSGWPSSYLLVSVSRVEEGQAAGAARGSGAGSKGETAAGSPARPTSSNGNVNFNAEPLVVEDEEQGVTVEEDDAPRCLTFTVVDGAATGAAGPSSVAALLHRFMAVTGLA